MADANTNPLGTTKAKDKPPMTAAPEAGSTQPQPAGPVIKKYEVQRDFEVPKGASSFLLRQGTVISSQGYDIPSLMKIGVRLKEVA